MKINRLTYMAPALLLTLAATACSDSDDWTPGPKDTDTGVCAYIVVPQKGSYIFGSTDANQTITVEVARQKTEDAVSIPLKLTSDDSGFSAPAAVDFAAGEATSSFTIDCSGIREKENVEVNVALDPSQTDVYGIGVPDITFTVIKADWKEISSNVKYIYQKYGSSDSWFPDTKNKKMWQLEGTNTFKLEDFFGSGLEMTFECDTPSNTFFVPQINADWDTSSTERAWYLYDEANQDWPEWVPGNAEGYSPITYLYFYSITDLYNSMIMVDDPETLYGFIYATTYLELADGSEDYANFYVTFNLNYNPFE